MKFVKIAGISAVVFIAPAILGVTLVFAQQPTPEAPDWWNGMGRMMRGGGMMGGGGMMSGNWQSMQAMHDQMSQGGGMGAMHAWMHQAGGVHDSVWSALAEQLGLTPDELSAEINSGKTLAQIAEEKGVSTADLAATMESGMKAGLAQAVEDGVMTQEQADLMLQQMAGRYEWMLENMGAGMLGGQGRGRMGPGSGGCHGGYTPDSGDSTSY